ncbi:MAG: DUF3592 domain-containing protein [Chloroflexi bacterium]|nr:DUF3592 domain-containing protein [Chloroflexota bacterium]
MAFLFGLGAAFMTMSAVLSLVRGITSKSWSMAEGEIISSIVQAWISEGSPAGPEYGRGGNKCYTPEITYSYKAQDSYYESRRIDAREDTGGDWGRKRSQRLVKKYYAGKRVQVYYNAKNPAQSVLKRGISLDAMFYIEAITGFIVLPGCMFWWSTLQPPTVVPWIAFTVGLSPGLALAYFLNMSVEKDNYDNGRRRRIGKSIPPDTESGSMFIPENRELTTDELNLLRWLLSSPKQRLEAYRHQIPVVRVVSSCACGCATIDLGLKPNAVRRVGPSTILANASGVSPTGQPVDVILHARDGELSELEIVWLDGVISNWFPQPSDLTLY